MVPELAGTAAAELAELRAAVFAAAAALPRGGSPSASAPRRRRSSDRDAAGTFAGYGADVRGRAVARRARRPADLPLCALIAGWVRGQVAPAGARRGARATPTIIDADAAVAPGRALRAEIDVRPRPVGVLVVADGAHTLTPPAPGGYDPDSSAVQAGARRRAGRAATPPR